MNLQADLHNKAMMVREKGIFLLPSVFTTGSLYAGFFSIVWSINSIDSPEPHYYGAAVAIIVASLFDWFDGRLARMTKTESDFGMYYDSLSDVCTFGIAPAILMYIWGLKPLHEWGWIASFFFFACGALRLARFNVAAAKKGESKKYFRGLPIPVAAGAVASVVMVHNFWEGVGNVAHYYMFGLAFILGLLMVSNVRFRSFKEFDIGGKVRFRIVMAFVALVIFIVLKHEVTIAIVYAAYILSGIIEEIQYWMDKSRRVRDIEPFIEEETEFLDEG